mgnify:CR=1 FL=1
MEQLTQFAPFILMFVVIYFFMIRPQQKKIKQEKIMNSVSILKAIKQNNRDPDLIGAL